MTFERKSANWVNESQTLNEGQHTVNLNTMEVRAIYFALFHMKETDKSKISIGSKKFDEMLRKFDAGRDAVHAKRPSTHFSGVLNKKVTVPGYDTYSHQ